ncbi:hypothetical protein A2970_01870 [Candidatus Roizmanbacteria bacterium RIFCSPLOWO2_01_FULL_44_13]|uniref:Baseplate protein J-like domain-containing protein n=1 Tax=Candidatus Roizmanbacteria bacterium RIFCSPLOWO2_01_FULL_44_13 TaxID=1802069 RepID=A0A1F7J9G8_9BACT|nr:MAG: hypothetical protein A2970_01870 [Candidatus Roizmanbacteria bacterium RIFCSPLOWO2_01_FULL_44_13]
MKLPFFSLPKTKQEYYLGLFLKEEEGTVMVIAKHRGRVEVRESEKFLYSNGWENLTDDIDEVLYRLEKKLGTTVNKTIFFVYSHFIDERAGDIKKPYLTKIKELVKNLELTAMGYIECIEGAARLMQSKESIPPTAIFIELDRHDFSLFVYKGGKQAQKISLARTDNITDDLQLALKDIKGQSLLPSRIVLYDGDNLDAAAEKIISFRFEEDYFVQLPRVDILPTDEIKDSLADIFAEQIVPDAGETVEEPAKKPEESFGFLINEDIKEKVVSAPPVQKPVFIMPRFNLPTLPPIPKINLSFLTGKVAAIVGVIIIIAALFLNEYFFHKADIKVYLASQPISKEADFELDYSIATSSAKFSDQAVATGQRQIGDPARGQVTLHNFDDKERVFAKGTVIQSAALNFLTDTEVKVASSSIASDGSAKLPGKNNAGVTAEAIGPEGNLAKGSRFTIEGLSNSLYFAINESALSGGTKKTVKTVAAEDQEKLEAAVLAAAKKQIKTPGGARGEILSTLTETEISQASFSREVGEEAQEVGIDADVETTFYLYDKDKLLTDIQEELKNNVKLGYSLDKSLISYKVDEGTLAVNENSLSLSLIINAKAIKKVSEADIIANLKGRHQNNLSVLKDKFGVQAYDLKINEPIPIFAKFLPFFKKNINLTISAR